LKWTWREVGKDGLFWPEEQDGLLVNTAVTQKEVGKMRLTYFINPRSLVVKPGKVWKSGKVEQEKA